MPRTYRAAVMSAPRAPMEVRELKEPVLEEGSVLMHTQMSEVCGTDVHLHHGRLAGVPYPIIPGHVSVGVVAALKGQVLDVEGTPFREGDVATFLDVHGTCGACWYCLVAKASTRCPKRKVYGITYGVADGLCGGWSEAIYLKPGVRLLRLPTGLDAETYCGGGCGVVTALHAVDRAALRLGDSVVVLGAGPVGQSVAALAALSGAGAIILVGAPDARLAFARRMGASDTLSLDLSEEERRAHIASATGGRGADVVIEASGDPEALRQALELVRDGGTVVIAGQYTDTGSTQLNAHRHINKKHVELRGCWGSDFSHFYRALELMARHRERVPWREMIDARFSLNELDAALGAVESRRVVKAAVLP
ncbi:MAG TPA: zinc-binding dehydrogenase [Polyangiaceae bacterium]|nr:zinc-binding dehydrogenase [Polyangiaceae bacterium]